MKLTACGRLDLRPINGYWFRAMRLKHLNTRLSTDHSRSLASRFSAASSSQPSYRTLYLGENHQVAIYEVDALLGSPNNPVADPKGSWAILSLHVLLDHVADLSDLSQQKLIGTNTQELTGRWSSALEVAPTQKLGEALYAVPRIEGVLFASSKLPSRNLLVFPDKLGPRSSIVFHNEITGRNETNA